MSIPLIDALRMAELRPGVYRERVNGRSVEVRVSADDTADQPVLLPWVEFPPTAAARTVVVQRGEPMLPPPLNLDQTDLAPSDLPDADGE